VIQDDDWADLNPVAVVQWRHAGECHIANTRAILAAEIFDPRALISHDDPCVMT
jgi:hypothetical protein